MARTIRKVELHFCDRDAFGKQRLATETRTYAIEDRYYQLDLCEEHAEMFDRDMGRWTMLSAQIDNPFDNAARPKSTYFTEERKEEARRVNELADQARREAASKEFAERRAAEIEADERKSEEDRARRTIPGAMKFRLTDHARERMFERGFTPWDVFHAVANPTHITKQPWLHPTRAVAYRDDCRVVFDLANGGIVTVIPRGAKVEIHAPKAGPLPTRAQERQAQ